MASTEEQKKAILPFLQVNRLYPIPELLLIL